MLSFFRGSYNLFHKNICPKNKKKRNLFIYLKKINELIRLLNLSLYCHFFGEEKAFKLIRLESLYKNINKNILVFAIKVQIFISKHENN